jgi:MFS transporter, ACS family, hexuronate transporter
MVFVSTIPWILGSAGLAISGLVCDLLSRITRDVLKARKLVLAVCLATAAICVGLAGLVSGLTPAVTLMALAIFFVYVTGAAYWAIVQETVESNHVGAVSGFVHLIANCAGIVGPAVTGFIVQASGVFTSAFVLAGAVAALGAIAVALFVRRAPEVL